MPQCGKSFSAIFCNFATRLLEQVIDLRYIQELLRHNGSNSRNLCSCAKSRRKRREKLGGL